MILPVKKHENFKQDRTTMETTGEVVVVTTARCTLVATSTEFKPELKKFSFAKNNFFPFNEPIRLQLLINRPRLTPLTTSPSDSVRADLTKSPSS